MNPTLRTHVSGWRGALLACCMGVTGLLPTLARAADAPGAAHGIDLAGMDRAIAPGDNFYAYANGTWMKSAEIPADRSAYGVFAVLSEEANKRTSDLIQELAKSNPPAGTNEQKIADYYGSYMDLEGIEAKGLKPIADQLKAIAAIKDKKQLAKALGATLRADVDPLNNTNYHTENVFGLWVAQDFDDPSRTTAYLLQGGLGLPDRDNYLVENPRMNDIRTKYRAHIAAMLKLANVADAEKKAEAIYALEHRIAEVHWTATDSRDVAKANNHWSRKDFDTKAPGLDWAAYFQGAGLEKQPRFIVWQPSAITGIAAIIGSTPIDTWKDFLTFRVLSHEAYYLPKAFGAERFAFYGTALSGTPKLRDRWKQAVDATDFALGQAVGKLYVAKYFPPESKTAAEKMVANIKAAFGERIDHLAWMAPETKAKAKEKLTKLIVGVGYPDNWRDYSGLKVVHGDAVGNHQRAELFEYHRNLKKLTSTVDRGEWQMNPQLVNAVNLPVQNALNFPAAILQPPFFDAKAPDAVNYGGIGSVIGHEISHSFDDEGALFDASGKLANWWTDADLKHFHEASAQLIAQYNQYHPFPDVSVNGALTLGENIADVAGLSAAYDAYRLSLGGKEAPVKDGLSGDQQFFLSFGQIWRTKFREPALRQSLLTNGHAPGEFRADTVRNLDAWYGAFAVKPGQSLYLAPKDRVRVW